MREGIPSAAVYRENLVGDEVLERRERGVRKLELNAAPLASKNLHHWKNLSLSLRRHRCVPEDSKPEHSEEITRYSTEAERHI